MAPGASLMVGKTSFTTTDIIAAIQNLIDFAESRIPPRPVAINLSLGLVTGPATDERLRERGQRPRHRSVGKSAARRRRRGERTGSERTFPDGRRRILRTRTISLHLLPTLSSLFFPQWISGRMGRPGTGSAKRTEYDEYTVSVSFPATASRPLGEVAGVPRG